MKRLLAKLGWHFIVIDSGGEWCMDLEGRTLLIMRRLKEKT